MPSVTLNFSAGHASRIQNALEVAYPAFDNEGVLVPATLEQLKDHLKVELIRFVRNIEIQQARDSAGSSVSPVNIT